MRGLLGCSLGVRGLLGCSLGVRMERARSATPPRTHLERPEVGPCEGAVVELQTKAAAEETDAQPCMVGNAQQAGGSRAAKAAKEARVAVPAAHTDTDTDTQTHTHSSAWIG